jgi:hypothetical protein
MANKMAVLLIACWAVCACTSKSPPSLELHNASFYPECSNSDAARIERIERSQAQVFRRLIDELLNTRYLLEMKIEELQFELDVRCPKIVQDPTQDLCG